MWSRVPIVLGVLTVLVGALVVFSGSRLVSRSPAPVLDAPGGRVVDEPAAPPGAYDSLVIPEFELVDQDGTPRTREIFAGRWTVLVFTFTHCPLACPTMNSNLLQLAEKIKDTPARLVSISVDPRNDTPAALRAHAERIGADTSRWTFLTGEPAQIERIVSGLRLALIDDPANIITLADGSKMNNILHPTQFLIVSPEVKVTALHTGLDRGGVEAAERTLRAGMRQAGGTGR